MIKINRQEAITKYPILPLRFYDAKADDEIFKYPKTFASYILTLPAKSYRGYTKFLGEQMVLLAENLSCDHFIFLGDIDVPWLKRLNTYESFQESLNYLVDNKIGKKFNGALQIGRAELPLFIKHLTWLVRTNGVLPYVHFVDIEQKIVADFCQYGNLHVSAMNKRADKNFKQALAESSFIFTTEESCYNRFSKSGAIKGRMPTR